MAGGRVPQDSAVIPFEMLALGWVPMMKGLLETDPAVDKSLLVAMLAVRALWSRRR